MDAQTQQTPSFRPALLSTPSLPVLKKRKRCGASVQLCDIYAKKGYRPGRKEAPRPNRRTQRGALGRRQRADTHSGSVTANPGGRRRTADASRAEEELRLSPYCCCYLLFSAAPLLLLLLYSPPLPPLSSFLLASPQSEQFACIIDDSQQNVRECFRGILKVILACRP